jgi:casein kinase II subunit alpha
VKPDNILVNYTTDGGVLRIKDVELSDFGDTRQMNPKEHMRPGAFGQPIGAAIFRSPEALLSMKWGAPTDIWSFGTTVRILSLSLSLST